MRRSDLLAKAVCQSTLIYRLTHRFREQARSYRGMRLQSVEGVFRAVDRLYPVLTP